VHVPLPGDWSDGQDYEAKDCKLKAFFDDGNPAEKDSCEHTNADPSDGADDVIDHKATEGHCAHPGYERRERPNDRHKAGDDDRLSAIVFEKLVRLIEVLLVQNLGFWLPKGTFPEEFSDPIVHDISPYRGGNEQYEHPWNADVVCLICSNDPYCEEQRVTWQEWEDHDRSFSEDDSSDNRIDQNSVLRCRIGKVLVEVADVLNKLQTILLGKVKGTSLQRYTPFKGCNRAK